MKSFEENVQIQLIPEFPDYGVTDTGEIWSFKFGRLRQLKPALKKNGYYIVALHKNRKSYTKLLHRLILRTFKGEPKPGQESLHKNGIRTNNCLDNLRWGTRKENEADKKTHGTDNKGERNGQSKLTTSDVRIIKGLIANGETNKNIAKTFNLNPACISLIKTGRRWRESCI